jgi:Flp pilus assembly protein TadD
MLRIVVAGAALALLLSTPAYAVDLDTTPQANAENADFAAGRKAVERKDWNEAVKRFSRVVSKEPNNADAHNMLGYSLRWQGDVNGAIASYERALAINPKHRGALEYSGIAFIKSGNTARAQDNLAKLKDVCGVNCEEYKDLAKAIAEQQAKK